MNKYFASCFLMGIIIIVSILPASGSGGHTAKPAEAQAVAQAAAAGMETAARQSEVKVAPQADTAFQPEEHGAIKEEAAAKFRPDAATGLKSVAIMRDGAEIAPRPEKPYEKVVAKNGSWYEERLDFGSGVELVVAYDGEYTAGILPAEAGNAEMKFSLGEKTVLKSIWLPYASRMAATISVKLTDGMGNVYGPFKTVESFSNTISVTPDTDGSGARKSSGAGLAESVNYIYNADQEIVLPAGKYTMTVSHPQGQVRSKETGETGAFLIKGVNYSANEQYKEKLRQWEDKYFSGGVAHNAKKLGNNEFSS